MLEKIRNLIVRLRTKLHLLVYLSLTLAFGLGAGLVVVIADSAKSPTAAMNPSASDPFHLGGVLTLCLLTPLAWWAFAILSGALWRMRSDFSWKFLMTTGALGLVSMAVVYDLVVLTFVRWLYTGPKRLPVAILPAPNPAKGEQVNRC